MLNAVSYGHQELEKVLNTFPNGTYIDATLGNGHDSQFILNHHNFKGRLLSFDIQAQAIQTCQEKFANQDKLQLIHDSHANLGHYLGPNQIIHGAIFNLGYLPGGDHDITTQFESTYQALEAISQRLIPKGKIILVVYHGHKQGKKERDLLLPALEQWPQDKFHILKYQFINQINNPPFCLVIEKR